MTNHHLLFSFKFLTLHRKVTQQKLEEFEEELNFFTESFNMHGPGTVGDDLEKGIHAHPLSC